MSEVSESHASQCENCYALNDVKWLLLVKRESLSNQRCVAFSCPRSISGEALEFSAQGFV